MCLRSCIRTAHIHPTFVALCVVVVCCYAQVSFAAMLATCTLVAAASQSQDLSLVTFGGLALLGIGKHQLAGRTASGFGSGAGSGSGALPLYEAHPSARRVKQPLSVQLKRVRLLQQSVPHHAVPCTPWSNAT